MGESWFLCGVYLFDDVLIMVEDCYIFFDVVFEVVLVDFICDFLGVWLIGYVFWMEVDYWIVVIVLEVLIVCFLVVLFGMFCFLVECCIWCGVEMVIIVW